MNKLNKVVRVAELAALADTVWRLWEAESALQNDGFLKKYFEKVHDFSEKITIAIKRDRTQSTLDQADSIRDEALKSLSDAIAGYAALPVAPLKEAAQKLQVVFDKYGRKIASENYQAESALIESLLQDLKKSDATNAISALSGVAEIVSALESAQTAFKKAYDDFAKSKRQLAESESASELKKPLLAVLNEKIALYLTAMCDEEGYKGFSSAISAEIDKMNSLVNTRTKKPEKTITQE